MEAVLLGVLLALVSCAFAAGGAIAADSEPDFGYGGPVGCGSDNGGGSGGDGYGGDGYDGFVSFDGYDGYGGSGSFGDCDTSRPHPHISAWPPSPRAGAEVQVTAGSRGRGLSYAWDLDDDGLYDDGPVAGEEPWQARHTFATAGQQRVRVRVTDADGREGFAERTVHVHAGNRAPAAAVVTAPAAPRAGGAVTVRAAASDSDGSVATIAFDLDDDGTFETPATADASVQTQFPTAGRRTLRVRVTDDGGETTVASTTVEVHTGNLAPIASLVASPSVLRAGRTASIWSYASDVDGSVARYEFDLDGNGSYETDSGTESTRQRRFDAAGTYDVGVRVTDDDGATTVARRTLQVIAGNDLPEVDLYASSGSTGTTASVGASDPDGFVRQIAWDLDEDEVYEDRVQVFDDDYGGYDQVEIADLSPGLHEFGVRVTDDAGGVSTRRTTIRIDPPRALRAPRIYVDSSSRPRVGDLVELGTSWQPDVSYAWDLDDDGAYDDYDDTDPTTSFATAGNHEVRVRVSDGEGRSATGSAVVRVSSASGPRAPALELWSYPSAPHVGVTVSLSATVESDGEPEAVVWDLDADGQFDDATGDYADVQLATPGAHLVSARVADADGAATLQRLTLDAHLDNVPPSVTLWNSADGQGAVGQPVELQAYEESGDDPIVDFAWDTDEDGLFDDAAGPNVSSQSVTFATSGTHRVRVRVTDAAGARAVGSDALVVRAADSENNPPGVSLSGGAFARPGSLVSYYASTSDSDGDAFTLTWDLDDDGSFDDATGAFASTSFARAGLARVRVRAADARGASAIAAQTTDVRAANLPPLLNTFDVAPSPRVGRPTSIWAYAQDPENEFVSYTYDLDGDGDYDDAPQGGSSPTWTPSSTAPVTIGVRATDPVGASATRTVLVRPSSENLAPIASILQSTDLYVAGRQATFEASAVDPDDPRADDGDFDYAWDLDGDGTYDDGDAQTATLTLPAGTLTLGLRVTDADGDTSTVRERFGIGTLPPSAAFEISDREPAEGQLVTFDSTATAGDGAIVSQRWDLDDDGAFDDATGTIAQRRFAAGETRAGLEVRDAEGEVAIAYELLHVRSAVAPVPSFSATTDEPAIGEDVTFSSTSSDPQGAGDIASQTWDLDGDGAFDDASGAVVTTSFDDLYEQLVRLRVVDQAGHASVARLWLYVTDVSDPVVGPPSNDDFANAAQLTGARPDATGSTQRATAEAGEPSPAAGTPAHSVWFRYDATATRRTTVGTCGSAFEAVVAVYRGSAIDRLERVALDADGACGSGGGASFDAVAGQRYWLALDGRDGQSGRYRVAVHPQGQPLAPLGDMRVAAQPLDANGAVVGDTSHATREAGEADHAAGGGRRSVWLRIDAPSTASIAIDACGSSFDTVLAVYAATGDGGALVASGDDAAGCGPGGHGSVVRFHPPAPGSYDVALDGRGDAHGAYRVALLANDDRARPTMLGTGAVRLFDTTHATAEPGEPAHAGSPASHSLWFALAPEYGELQPGQRIVLDTCATEPDGLDTVLAAYTLIGGRLVELASSDDSAGCGPGGSGSEIRFAAPSGPLYVAVDGRAGAVGRFAVRTRFGPPNDDRAAAAELFGGEQYEQGDTTSATHEPGEPDHAGAGGSHSVWYVLHATRTSPTAVDVCSASFDARTAVYTEAQDGGLELVVAGDDGCRVDFRATEGVSYFVAVDGHDGAAGTFTLHVQQAPYNDDFASPEWLYDSAYGATGLASAQLGEPDHAGAPAATSLWYALSTDSTDDQSLSTCSHSDVPTRLAVYEGTELAALVPVAAGGPVAGCAGGRGARVHWTPPDDGHHTYWIAVDRATNDTGEFVLAREQGPANDRRANAYTLYDGSTFAGTTVAASHESGEPDHAGAGGAGSVWYRWQPGRTAHARVQTCRSVPASDTIVAVYRGDGSTLTPVGAADDTPGCGDGRQSRVEFDASAQETYWIAVDARAGDAAPFQLQAHLQPLNDDRADAAQVLGDSAYGQLDLATTEPGEPDHAGAPGGHSIWFRWTAPATGPAAIDSCSSPNGVDTLLAVYTASGETLLPIASDDDTSGCGGGRGSRVQFAGVAGTEYLIAIAGKNGAEGSVALRFPPPNDFFDGAVAVGGDDFTVYGDLTRATAQAGEPAHLGVAAEHSVWWRWTAPRSALATLDMCGYGGMRIAAYTGAGIGDLTAVTAAPRSVCGASQTGARLRFAAVAGTTYRIAVDATGSAARSFSLRGRLSPANDAFATAANLGTTSATTSSGTTVSASVEAGEPDHAGVGGGASVWYRWTAPRSATLRVDSCSSGTSFDTAIALYSQAGAGVAGLAEVASNDDDATGCGSNADASRIRTHVTAGSAYWIAVSGRGDAEGDFDLRLVLGPANDDLANATPLLGGGISGTTIDAGRQAGEPDHAAGGGDHSVWYQFTLAEPRNVELRVCPATGAGAPVLAAYTGTELLALTPDGTRSTRTIDGVSCQLLQLRGVSGRRLVAVDGAGSAAQSSFTLTLAVAPPNDDRASADSVGGATAVTGTTSAASSELGEPAHAGVAGGRSVWFRWTAPHSGPVGVDTCSSSLDTLLAVYVEDGDALDAVGASDDAAGCGSGGSRVTFTAQAGTEYLIAVDGRGGAEGSFVLGFPPPNDLFEAADPLAGELATVDGNLTRAGLEPGEPDHAAAGASRSAWYAWTPPRTGRAQISTCLQSSAAVAVALYSGEQLGALVLVAASGPVAGCAGGRGAVVRTRVTSGTAYRIAVAGDAQATFTLQAALAPVNDDVADAREVSTQAVLSGSSAFATAQDDEPARAGHDASASVWYRFTPTSDGPLTLKTCGSAFATVLGVYDRSGAPLHELAAADDAPGRCAGRAAVTFTAAAGTEYLVAVDGQAGATGAFALAIGAPANDDVQDATALGGEHASGVADSGAATTQDDEPTDVAAAGRRSVWWSWTAPATAAVEVNTCGSSYRTHLGVYHGAGPGGLTRDAQQSIADGCDGRSRLTLDAQAGRTYLIAVSSYDGLAGPVRLQVGPPANDRFAAARQLDGEQDEADDTFAGASTEDHEPAHGAAADGRSIWYAWTAPDTGLLTLDTCGSPTSAQIAVYTGAEPSVATRLAPVPPADDCAAPAPGRTVTVPVDAGAGYRIALDAERGAGAGPSHLRLRLNVDHDPPTTTIADGPPAATNATTDAFSFSADEDDVTFACRLDDGVFAPCSSPATRSGLDEGAHVFYVQATDLAGNVEPEPASWPFTVDRTPPAVTVDDGPPQFGAQTSVDFTFSSPDASASFACALDDEPLAACDSPASRDGLADGPHSWQVRATDPAGNASSTTSAFTVDTVAPVTVFTSFPDDPTRAPVPSVAFGAEQGSTFVCAVDDGDFAPCSSPYDLPGLGDGVHDVRVRATDRAGNEEQPAAARSFRIDRSAPQTTLDEQPSSPVTDRTARFAFSGDEAATFRCSLDGEEPVACTSPQTYTIRTDGDHAFAVFAVDAAGNEDLTPATATFTVQTPNSAPTGSLSLDAYAGTTPLHVRAAITGQDVDDDPIAYRLSFGDGSPVVSGTLPAPAVEHVYEQAGSFLVQLTLDDGAATTVRTATVTASAPEPLRAAAGDDRRAVAGENVVFDGGASRPQAAIERYDWDFGDGATAAGRHVAHAFSLPGTYTARLTTTAAGGTTDVDSATVTVVAPAPVGEGLRVHVASGGAPLPGAGVTYVRPDGTRQTATADSSGTATLHGLPDGGLAVSAWADGFQPKTVTTTVLAGSGDVTVELASGEIGAATLESHRMTYEEILAAGIDVADPANSHVYEAEIHLYFGPPDFEYRSRNVHVYVGEGGVSCASDCGLDGGGGGGPSSGRCDPTAAQACWPAGDAEWTPYVTYVGGQPVIQWLVLPMRASFLKEFFDVKMVVQNLTSDFSFAAGVASLPLPEGLSLATTSEEQAVTKPVASIPAGGSRTVDWVVRGDVEGEYDLTADYSSTVDPIGQPVYLRARTRSPLKVWAASALETTIRVDREAVRWGPYAVDVEIRNVSDTPIYNTQIEMFDRTPGAPEDIEALFFYAPQPPTTQGTAVIQPRGTEGDVWTARFVVYAGIGNDEVSHLYTKLRESFVQKTGGDVDLRPTIALREGRSLGPDAGPVVVRLEPHADDEDQALVSWNRPTAPAGRSVTGYELWTRQGLDGGRWELYRELPGATQAHVSVAIPAHERAIGRYYGVGTKFDDGEVRFVHLIGEGMPRYVSLGDSYSSGEGVPEFEPGTANDIAPTGARPDNNCHRSWGAYGRRLLDDETVDANLQPARFAACSGAVTADVYDDNARNEGERPQLDHVNDFTDVISLSMGGNDIGFKDIAVQCLLFRCDESLELYEPVGSKTWADHLTDMWDPASFYYQRARSVSADIEGCRSPTNVRALLLCPARAYKAIRTLQEVDDEPERVANPGILYDGTLYDRLVRMYTALAEKAPNARILVQPYPHVIYDGDDPGGTCNLLPGIEIAGVPLAALSRGDRVGIDSVVTLLNGEIRRAVDDVNGNLSPSHPPIDITKPDDFYREHELCRNGRLNPRTYLNSVVNPILSTPGNYGPIIYSFHPNTGGQEAYEKALAASLRGVQAEVSRVRPGEHTLAGTVFVPYGARTVRASTAWPGSTVRLTLVSPSGAEYDRDTPGVAGGRTETSEWLAVPAPESGTWSVRLFGEDVAPEGEPTQVTAYAEMPLPQPPRFNLRATRVAGQARVFDLVADGPADADYRWSFSDASSAQGASVRHAFTGDQAQWATVEAIGADGASSWETIDVGAPDLVAPEVALTAPADRLDTADATPEISGTAGTSDGSAAATADLAEVGVEIRAGADGAGESVATIATSRAANGDWSTTPTRPLADGTYSVRAQQLDDAGNRGLSGWRTFRVDTIAPQPAVTAPADGDAIADATPTLAGSAGHETGGGAHAQDADLVTLELWRGTTPVGPPAQTLTAARTADGAWEADVTQPLDEGAWTARAVQVDAAGNSGSSPPRTFEVDTTAPIVTVAQPLAGADLGDGTPTVSGGAGALDGDVTLRLWSGDAASGTPARTVVATRTGDSWDADLAQLADGTWTIRADQLDRAGNLGSSALRSFRIDTSAPVVQVQAPAEGLDTNDTTPALAGVAGAEDGSAPTRSADGAVNVRLFAGRAVSGQPIQTVAAVRDAGAWTAEPTAPLADGTYAVEAAQPDAAGNVGRSSARSFRVDTVAPVVTVDSEPDGNDVTPTLAGTAGSADGSQPAAAADAAVVTIEVWAGSDASGAPNRSIAATRSGGGWSAEVTPALSAGRWTARVVQADAAGNLGRSATTTFKLDTTAPAPGLEPVADTRDATPHLTGTAGDDDGAAATSTPDGSTVTVRLWTGATATGAPARTLAVARSGASWSADVTPALADGTWTAVASQPDVAGNSGSSPARTFKLDATAPALTIAAPASGSATADPTPLLSGAAGSRSGADATASADDATVAVELFAGAAASGAPLRTAQATRSGASWSVELDAPLADGLYTARATQHDALGNAATATSTFTVDTAAPIVGVSSPANGQTVADSSPSLAGTAGDAAGDDDGLLVRLWPGAAPAGAASYELPLRRAGGSWSTDAPELGAGLWTLVVDQRDRAGNRGSATSSFLVAPPAPPTPTPPTPVVPTTPAEPPPAAPPDQAPRTPAPDRKPPVASVGRLPAAGALATALLGRGLAVGLVADETSNATGELLLPYATARRLGLRLKRVTIGRKSYVVLLSVRQALTAGRRSALSIRLSARLRDRLSAAATTRLLLRITLRDPAGNISTTTRTIVVRRVRRR